MTPSFSLAANVCLADLQMIKVTVPNWLRVFKERLNEIVLVVDTQPPTGRLADTHKHLDKAEILIETIDQLKILDNRIRMSIVFSETEMKEMLKKWFKKGTPIRCQGGTVIGAFIQAVEEAQSSMVLRCDCDMLFYENGWLSKASELLEKEEYDLIEPPRLGYGETSNGLISGGAFMVMPELFRRSCLPIKAHRIDFARQIHRFLKGKPTWLAFEEMFTIEKVHGRLRHYQLDDQLGFSLHIPTRSDVLLPGFENIVSNVESGRVPESQRIIGRNFSPSKWPSEFWNQSTASVIDSN